MIPRILAETISTHRRKGFLNVIYGPRRVGKTILLKQITAHTPDDKILWINGDAREDCDLFSKPSLIYLEDIVKYSSTIVIDEAQRIPNIALSLKVLIDNVPDKDYYVTGSSSLMLAKGLHETLTGRTQIYNLYPFSTRELLSPGTAGREAYLLESQLLYGGYPYLLELSRPQDKRDYLLSIVDDYLFKEVMYLKDVSSPEKLRKVAAVLALRIGEEVSLNDLAKTVALDVKTVQRYISLLEQNFIIFSIGGFARNLPSEISQSKKYFFWDAGIRNALIDQFHGLDLRSDTAQLWHNFLAIERLKKHECERERRQYYFWRTYDGAQIDWLEEAGGKLEAYSFRWDSKPARTPKSFLDSYGPEVVTINRQSYLPYVL